jgi:hypothetical protein
VLRRTAAALIACLAAAGTTGCGNARTPVPDVERPAAPDGFRTLTLNTAGLRLITPRNWTVSGQSAPLVLTLNSGPAVVALWRQPRAAPPPETAAGLRAATRSLMASVRRRDRSIAGLRATPTIIDGARAIRLDARERIDGRLRRVISTHIYVDGAEVVLDEYAPPGEFDAVARTVFAPVRRSLTLLPVVPSGS